MDVYSEQVGKKRQCRPSRGDSVSLYPRISSSRIFFILFVLDLDQCVEKQTFHQGGITAVEIFFHGNPDIMGLLKQKAVQPEPLFHFPLDEIPLDRVADLAINGNGKPTGRTVVP
jgi:hypothetical protein